MAQKYWLITTLLLYCLFAPQQIYAQKSDKNPAKVTIQKIDFSAQNNLEITVSDKTEFRSFTLKNPNRLVIDIGNSTLAKTNTEVTLPYFVSSWRNGLQKDSTRVVFDLKQEINISHSSFQKLKNQHFGKIIIEFDGVTKTAVANNHSTYHLTKKSRQNIIAKIINKTPIIVIDAGHGGKDPGTIGDYARTKEKNVTLSYAKELKKNLESTKNYKVFLTRGSDFFIPLRQRVSKSRKWKADLFISLHANSIAEPRTSGFSIYTLSEKSSDRQAALLAQKENRADIIAGVNFSDASPDIMKTLIDLSRRDTMNSSSRFANIVIKSVQKSEIKILQNSHRFAGFAVLTAPDMASVLIELGYLSNRHEESQLNSLIYKRKLTAAIAGAVDEYFYKTKK